MTADAGQPAADPPKIEALVRSHLADIFRHCETVDHGELDRLCDPDYSRRTFRIGFPFCRRPGRITPRERVRYWSQIHVVRGVSVRVTSQWFDPPTTDSRARFLAYLRRIGVTLRLDPGDGAGATGSALGGGAAQTGRPQRARYRSAPVGVSQNALVRHLLGQIRDEIFDATAWEKVKAQFGGRCAYCGGEGPLVMDHIVPINRTALGEHRLGNLAPACDACNAAKAGQAVEAFLADRPDRLSLIHAHMERHDYAPPGENPQVALIMAMAHAEVAQLAARYIRLLDALAGGAAAHQAAAD